MEESLKEKTGKSLQEWIKIVKKSEITKHKEIIDFLKTEHGFTYGFANFVSLKSRKSDAASLESENIDLVQHQYKGKEDLTPIYEKLISSIQELCTDFSINPKKAAVSLVRKKQFALIKPATKTRIDLGLKIKDKEITERLEKSGPFGTMCTHRVRITSIEDIDTELLEWIKEAYEKAQ